MKKKSQTEILGVMVIVIILVIAGVFMLSRSTQKKELPADSFVEPEQAQSFLNSILRTRTKLNIEVGKLIQHCYDNLHTYCGTATTNCCSYTEKVLTNALEETLGKWGKTYKLTISQSGLIKIPVQPGPESISNGCSEFSEREKPGTATIPNIPRPAITITLEICK